MISVRFATSAANMSENTIMVCVRRLPSETRPSTLFALMMVVVFMISEEEPVPSSPQRRRNPTMMNAASSEEPPWLTKGSVMPVRGMSLVTPPTMMNAWSTMIEVRPAPISELTSDFARAAVTKPRIAKHRYKSSRPAAPKSPVSSPMAAKMKSLSTTGMRVMPLPPPAMPRPIPVPNRSPSASE